jgi:hypothetical protein
VKYALYLRDEKLGDYAEHGLAMDAAVEYAQTHGYPYCDRFSDACNKLPFKIKEHHFQRKE